MSIKFFLRSQAEYIKIRYNLKQLYIIELLLILNQSLSNIGLLIKS